MAYNDSTNKYSSHIIVVDAAGLASPITTVAAGIAQAATLGLTATTIFVREGTYNENLALVAGINIEGEDRETTIINGTHTIPLAGTLKFSHIKLAQTTPATNLFTETGVSSCTLYCTDCLFYLDSGVLFNLPTSTGSISLTHCYDISASNSLIIKTEPTSAFRTWDCNLGAGVNPALIACTTALRYSTFSIPFTFSSTASVVIDHCFSMTGTITLADTASCTINNSQLNTAANPVINIGATATAFVNNIVVTSAAANIFTGTGAITYGEVTCLSAFTHNVTTETYTTRLISGSLQLDETNAGIPYFTAGVMGSTAALSNGQMLIGSTGNPPSVGTISAAAGSGITVTTGAGTLALASTAPFTWTQINADGALIVNQGSVNIKAGLLTMSLPATSAVNTVIKLVGVGAGGWTITQAANQQILVGNTHTTLGAGGTLSSTNAGDCVSMVCTTADLVWRVFGMVGNLTVV